jgi:hypothetical protein
LKLALIITPICYRHRYDYDGAVTLKGDEKKTANAEGHAEYQYAPPHLTLFYSYHYMGRPGRRKMVDRVVRYKYPSKIGTNYQKEHAHFNSAKAAGKEVNGNNFNVEKEHKIINPHNVEKLTVNRIDYQPFTIQPREPKKLKAPSPKKIVAMKTSYQNEFQNWGPNEVIHEKDPKYPYYSLPFKGTSSYARTFCGGSDAGNAGRGLPFGEQALKSQYGGSGMGSGPHGQSMGHGGSQFGGSGMSPGYNAGNPHMGSSATNLRPLLGATNSGNGYETTNQRAFKNYQLKHTQRPQTCKPKAEAIRTKGNKQHYITSHKNDFSGMKYRPPAVDMIPYP